MSFGGRCDQLRMDRSIGWGVVWEGKKKKLGVAFGFAPARRLNNCDDEGTVSVGTGTGPRQQELELARIAPRERDRAGDGRTYEVQYLRIG